MTKKKLFEEYYALHDEYTSRYGEKVAVFMQVGKFFEVYAPADYSSSGNIREITSLLNCKLTWKETERMAGFPLMSLDKNVKKLTENDYTVVVVEQMQPDASTTETRLPRRIVQVVSKGTYSENSRLRNNIMSIYVRKFAKGILSFGIAVTDTVISKDITVHEIHSTSDDKGFALDTATRFVAQYEPVECIITTQYGDITTDLQRHLGLTCSVFFRDVQDIPDDILESVEDYPDAIMYALGSLKTFLQDHVIDVSKRSMPVVHFVPENHLDLCSTAIKQLDIPLMLDKSYGINQTITSMGNRLLTERLYSPVKNVQELEDRYNAIEAMDAQRCKTLRNVLREIPDLARLHQWLSYGRLSWGQFRTLCETFNNVVRILPEDYKMKTSLVIQFCSNKINMAVENFVDQCEDQEEGDDEEEGADDDDAAAVTPEKRPAKINLVNIFVQGAHPDLDEAFEKLRASQKCIDDIIEKAKMYIVKRNPFKIKEKTGLITTHAQAEKLSKQMGMKVLKMKSNSIVYTEDLRNSLIYLNDAQDEIAKLTNKYLSALQLELYERYEPELTTLVNILAELDVQQCAFTIAKKMRLVRPKISSAKGVLRITKLRHLLIETINQHTRYVPNDCLMEHGKTQGMLLYGVNSCGKTSFLKSVGLAVVLAQAGFFVPAESMELSLFSRIMTRIAGSDNMERSQSSYIVELEELLSMIQRSDEETLILGDEMCRGTEVESANAMVYTTLEHLIKKKSLFVAATHLHTIAKKVANSLPNVKIFHMRVSFDKEGNVEYDRKLTEGSGSELYGLEIAKAMRFPVDFIEAAMKFRDSLEVTSLLTKQMTPITIDVPPPQSTIRKSRYNAKKTLQKCECCSYKPTDVTSLPLDTHHIEFQCNADEEGYHGSQHKNALHNLVSVCKQCHLKIHAGEIVVENIQTLKRGTKHTFKTTTSQNEPQQATCPTT